MTGLSQDIRYACRSLLKRRGFSAIVIFALALCIGANTAIFSVVDSVLLKPLAYRDPSRLVYVSEALPALLPGFLTFSAPDYVEMRREDQLFETAGTYRGNEFELSGIAEPQRVEGARISASLFPMLGVAPALGRNFTEQEDRDGRHVVLLGSALWQAQYGASPNIIGKQIKLDRASYTVIGVMPPGFVFPPPTTKDNNDPASLYVPMSFTQTELRGFGNMYNDSVIARLKPGVTLAQANTELKAIAERIATTVYPPDIRKYFTEFGISSTPLHQAFVGDTRPMLLLLFGAVALVLLVGCADVAGLALTRAAGRQREMSIRVALGASRAQLIRHVLVESLLLALLGGAFGFLLCAWTGGILTHLANVNLPESAGIQFNPTVLLFNLAVSVSTALLFGSAPALRASQVDVSQGVKESGRSQSTSQKHGRILDMIVVTQFGLALMLLVGAGLLVRSLGHLLASNPGFRPDHILRMDVSLPGSAYPTAGDMRDFYNRLNSAVEGFPGAKAAGLATSLPLSINEHRSFFIDGQHSTSIPHSTAQIWVLGNFFRAMGIPLLRGRYLDDNDVLHSLPVVLVNKTLAHQFWPNANALGQRIRWGNDDPWMTVVGVIGDVKQEALNEDAAVPETYSPWRQTKDGDLSNTVTSEYREMTVVVRTANAPASVAPGIEKLIHRMDPSLPVTNVTTMEAQMADSVRSQRFQTTLFGGFAMAALILAALGIGGVLAYSVAQRVAEIGIRMALGATRRSVLSLILIRGLKLAITGIVLGLVAALLAARLLSHLLYQTSPHDPLTFFAAPVFLCAVGLLAILFPARRAATVDPIQSLRAE